MTTPEQQARDMLQRAIHFDLAELAYLIAENAALKAELQALRGSAEPVAWGLEELVKGRWVLRHPIRFTEQDAEDDKQMYTNNETLRVVPLYTRPAVPLTDEAIDDCIDKSQRDFNLRRQGFSGQQLTPYDDWRYWFARAIEAHIKGAKA